MLNPGHRSPAEEEACSKLNTPAACGAGAGSPCFLLLQASSSNRLLQFGWWWKPGNFRSFLGLVVGPSNQHQYPENLDTPLSIVAWRGNVRKSESIAGPRCLLLPTLISTAKMDVHFALGYQKQLLCRVSDCEHHLLMSVKAKRQIRSTDK